MLEAPFDSRPEAYAGNYYTIVEGYEMSFDGSGSTDADGDELWYRWDFEGDGNWDTTWTSDPRASHTWEDDYLGTVYLEVFDGHMFDVDKATIKVLNSHPYISNVLAADSVDEDSVVNLKATVTDLGKKDKFTLKVNWGDGTEQTFNYPGGTTTFQISLNHMYLDDWVAGTSYDDCVIRLEIFDDDGDSGMANTVVRVRNVAPVVDYTVSDSSIIENEYLTISGQFTDPGTKDTFMLVVDWGDGGREVYANLASTALSFRHQYLDDGRSSTPSDVYTITVVVMDDDGGSGSKSTTVVVRNDLPQVSYINALTVNEGELFERTLYILDDGILDTITGSVDWRDGTAENFYLEAGERQVTLSHRYLDENPDGSGYYCPLLQVNDDDDATKTHKTSSSMWRTSPRGSWTRPRRKLTRTRWSRWTW